MNDLISRQDAIIELVFNEETKDIKCEDMRKVLNVLKKMPSEKSEIVHCKDCKYYYNLMYNGTQFEYGKCCRTFTEEVKPDDYCSRGEQDG